MKVSIPKKDIDKIIEDYKCSESEAIKAYLDADENARLSFENTLRKELSRNRADEPIPHNIKLFTPKEIKEHLDRYVIGQEEYKERLCIAAAYHFSLVKYCRQYQDSVKIKRFRKKNTFISGPSGSGKTYTVEVLGDFIQIPTLMVDATDYTEVGYVGKSSDDMVRELIDLAPGNSRKEQAAFIADNGGIIFIDEMDKKAKEASMILACPTFLTGQKVTDFT
jgi:ATP-dependent protease Clp ATPase subunit